jgi:hypothetical protein
MQPVGWPSFSRATTSSELPAGKKAGHRRLWCKPSATNEDGPATRRPAPSLPVRCTRPAIRSGQVALQAPCTIMSKSGGSRLRDTPRFVRCEDVVPCIWLGACNESCTGPLMSVPLRFTGDGAAFYWGPCSSSRAGCWCACQLGVEEWQLLHSAGCGRRAISLRPIQELDQGQEPRQPSDGPGTGPLRAVGAMTLRRFPPPWTVVEHPESFWVQTEGRW